MTERAEALEALTDASAELLAALDAWQRALSTAAQATDWRTVGEWTGTAHTTAYRWSLADPPHVPAAAAAAAQALVDRRSTGCPTCGGTDHARCWASPAAMIETRRTAALEAARANNLAG